MGHARLSAEHSLQKLCTTVEWTPLRALGRRKTTLWDRLLSTLRRSRLRTAQIALAYYYETGTVVTGSQSQAIDLYRKAAQQGDPLAGWLVGRHYFLGNGVARDADAAQKWLEAIPPTRTTLSAPTIWGV